MKSNLELQKDVQAELNWEPILNAAEIGVTAKDGVVTLTGVVDSYSKKLAAERAAKRVLGVRAVAEDIEVRILPGSKRTDTDIAQAALGALKWSTSVPDQKITLEVENGWVYLEGEVEWQYQKDAAKNCVEDLLGVVGVTNSITLKPRVDARVVKQNIKSAFARNAAVEAEKINVDTFNNRVILKGTVHTWAERTEAERAAWSAPGVVAVEDELLVSA